MTSVKKGTYTWPVPDDAKIIEKKGKKFARFKLKGRTVDAPLTADGKKCPIETAEYYIHYKDAASKWQWE